MHDTASLDRDSARLSNALWSAVSTLGGRTALELCRSLGSLAMQLREGQLARSAFRERIEGLSNEALEDLSRPYALWCHLMNSAEERQRLRVLRARGDHAPDGLTAAIDGLIDSGISETELRAWFDRALVMPVITAHPTEARRRSSLDHLARMHTLLDDVELAGRTRSEEAIASEVLALHATEDSRARRPTPLDEVENALDVVRRSLLDVTPRIYRTIERCVRSRFGDAKWRIPPFFRWGSWVGGDRDGNPSVTSQITRVTLARHRAVVLDRYLDDVAALGRSLSVSELRARGPIDELLAALEHDRERLPEVAARARPRTTHEPWREKLWYVQARLRATIDHRDEGYVDADEYTDDLELLDRGLRSAGFTAIAEQGLHDAIRRVEVFGFHLASLDLRQHSNVHDKVTDEILARGGRPGYLELDESGRRGLLREILSQPISPLRDPWDCSPTTRETLAALEVAGRARRELGPHACERYIVSFTREVSDLMEVAFLARAAGLAPGELRPVPLLEQLEDLERAGQITNDLVAEPALRIELGNELEVMIGYSDSSKQVGFFASAVALRRAQLELVGAAERAGMLLTLFHGRGGALGRGGGPASEAIRAQPVAAVRGRLRVTEQGETVTARYAHPEIAERDLELALGAIFAAATAERTNTTARHPKIASDTQHDEALLDRAADAARKIYLELTSDEDRLVRYALAATPIEDVAHLPLGSRPASRKGTISLDSLRAIPWVFSWTQSRHGIPGWFGVGTAIETLANDLGTDGLRAFIDRSRFMRRLIDNTELSLVRSDIDVAREYARLAEPDCQTLFDLIADEHARTVKAIRDIVGHSAPITSRPYLAASVARRNAFLDVLSHVQIEVLRRRRANEDDKERLTRIVFTTINGIAAGLQTAG